MFIEFFYVNDTVLAGETGGHKDTVLFYDMLSKMNVSHTNRWNDDCRKCHEIPRKYEIREFDPVRVSWFSEQVVTALRSAGQGADYVGGKSEGSITCQVPSLKDGPRGCSTEHGDVWDMMYRGHTGYVTDFGPYSQDGQGYHMIIFAY